ncbi:hypothetical protein ACEN2P_02010 [Pedobacter psychrotolerans]|uniref:hypothetical protein n=1 Tax=Pedobacter psychrotolerans TaxID=1843235 RepID=UPI003F9D09F3
MLRKIMGCAVLVLATHITFAQDEFNVEVQKDIIILNSTKDYKLALSTAKKTSAALHKKLDLRGLMPNHKIGLSMSKGDCMEDAGGDENDLCGVFQCIQRICKRLLYCCCSHYRCKVNGYEK